MSNASMGQAVVNPDAPSHPAHPASRSRHLPPARRAAPPEKKPAAQASTARASNTPAKPPTVAPAPPPTVALAPAVTAPPKPTAPPPPVPVVADATGVVSPLSNGVRITFGATSSDLNPAMVDAIRSLARTMDATAGSDVSLYAYSSGPADDPSTPRRLALQRALAVRAVLISEGIASTRIYPRVQAPTAPASSSTADPSDRVDMVMSSPATPAATNTAKAP